MANFIGTWEVVSNSDLDDDQYVRIDVVPLIKLRQKDDRMTGSTTCAGYRRVTWTTG
jgi:hypothetical protein